MQVLMRLMEECPLRDEGDEVSKRAVEDSLWPSLCTRLVTLTSPRCDHFNGWIPAVTVAAVCLAMVLIASPPQMLSPQDARQYSSAGDNAWRSAKPVAIPTISNALPQWDEPPITTSPTGAAKPPKSSLTPPSEMNLAPGSVDSFVPELDGPFEIFIDDSDPSGPRIYLRTE
jgi:hypothetical protein